MPRLSEAISTLKIDGKTFTSPEWWSSKHKLTRQVKNENLTKELIQKHTQKLVGSLEVNTLESQPSADVYVRQMQTLLDTDKYGDFAPWNPIFRKSRPIFIDRK